MKSVNKNVGFFCLLISSTYHAIWGDDYLAAAFLISALFYDAIAAKEKAE